MLKSGSHHFLKIISSLSSLTKARNIISIPILSLWGSYFAVVPVPKKACYYSSARIIWIET